MAAIDTNVLLRFLLQDKQKRAVAATRLVPAALNAGKPLHVPVSVALELERVLRSRFEMDKAAASLDGAPPDRFTLENIMTDDPRCCGSGTCLIDAEGRCWCGQRWDGQKMCFAPPPGAPPAPVADDRDPDTP